MVSMKDTGVRSVGANVRITDELYLAGWFNCLRLRWIELETGGFKIEGFNSIYFMVSATLQFLSVALTYSPSILPLHRQSPVSNPDRIQHLLSGQQQRRAGRLMNVPRRAGRVLNQILLLRL